MRLFQSAGVLKYSCICGSARRGGEEALALRPNTPEPASWGDPVAALPRQAQHMRCPRWLSRQHWRCCSGELKDPRTPKPSQAGRTPGAHLGVGVCVVVGDLVVQRDAHPVLLEREHAPDGLCHLHVRVNAMQVARSVKCQAREECTAVDQCSASQRAHHSLLPQNLAATNIIRSATASFQLWQTHWAKLKP